MVHILSGRAETPTQSKILTSVRDEGPLSRIDLAGRLGVSRTTVAAEAGRLVELGLAVDGGPAAAPRRPPVPARRPRPAAALRRHRPRRHLDRVAVTDGRLQVLARDHKPLDIRRGPETVLRRRARAPPASCWRPRGSNAPRASGIGVPGPVDFQDGVPVSPPIMPGWDRYPVRDALSRELGCPVLVDNDVNIMALGEQHAGVARSASDFLFVKIGTGIGCGIVVGGQVYRGADGCAGDIGHIRHRRRRPGVRVRQRRLPRGVLRRRRAGPGRARRRPGRAAPPVLAERLEEDGVLTAESVGPRAGRGDATALAADPRRRPAGRHGAGQPGQLLQPGLIVIGGGVAGLGHMLLAEIRSSIYRRSLPLATGNLPVVLSELGADAGVIGAARLISDAVYAVA